MTAVQRLVANGNSIINFLKNFSSNVAQDVGIEWLNDDGTVETKTFPNIQKFQDSVNLKNVDGKIVDNTGADVKVEDTNKIGGMTKDEVVASLYGNLDVTRRFKFLINTARSFPERWMVGVNYNDDLVFWGYENHYVSGAAQQYGDNLGFKIIPQPFEKVAGGIKIKELKAFTWGLYVLYEDNDLYVLGYNNYGQLGTGNTASVTKLTKVLSDVSKVEISSHGYHQDQISTLVLKTDGTVWGAGKNSYGQLSRGTTTDNMNTFEKCQFTSDLEYTDTIIDVFVTDTNVISTYCLTDTGKVFASGWNGDGGALGLGDTTNRSTFSLVGGDLATEKVVEMVTSGGTRNGDTAYYRHSVLVRCESGKLYSWGNNEQGNLGIGSTVSQAAPVEIPWDVDTQGNVTKLITSRGSWTNYYALTDLDKLYAWGHNGYGSLGIGNTTGNISSPTLASENVLDAYTLMGGATYCYHNGIVVLLKDGQIMTAGQNTGGVLGNNTTSDSNGVLGPLLASFKSSEVKQVSVGGHSSAGALYFLLNDGRVYATGENSYQNVSVYHTGANQPVPCLIGV